MILANFSSRALAIRSRRARAFATSSSARATTSSVRDFILRSYCSPYVLTVSILGQRVRLVADDEAARSGHCCWRKLKRQSHISFRRRKVIEQRPWWQVIPKRMHYAAHSVCLETCTSFKSPPFLQQIDNRRHLQERDHRPCRFAANFVAALLTQTAFCPHVTNFRLRFAARASLPDRQPALPPWVHLIMRSNPRQWWPSLRTKVIHLTWQATMGVAFWPKSTSDLAEFGSHAIEE